ncbi:hypothetical protein DRO61_08855 [Candidatus Bathyarchaeota archaeon]|nr:MAG: hypothetical protein DRO61_08855 [Candidatus Bathyarchaeota archaeon]
MVVPDYKDAVWLKNAYLHKKQTMNSIASSCGVSPMTIQNWLDRHQIPTRPRGRTVASSVAPPRLRNQGYVTISVKEYDKLKEAKLRLENLNNESRLE